MSTPIDGTTYPFDPTGTLASNLITGEMQILTVQNYRDYHFIVPFLAPYFTTTLKVVYQDPTGNVSTLVEGVDYVCTHVFHDASLACAAPIAGSISFYNTLLAGQVQLQYQTLGGIWTLNSQEIATILADQLHNPRVTTWEQVTEQPVTFPVIDHEWDLVDLVGMSDVVTELQNIEAAIRAGGATGLAAHIADHSNPHQVTATQVGLSLVQNFGIAGISDAIAGVSNTLYMTPAMTAQAVANIPSQALAQHEANYNNPHQTTAAEVGLGNVPNYPAAQTADAIAGTSNTVLMTPLMVATQIGNGLGQALAEHEDNYSNPHQVNAHQTGAYLQSEVNALLGGYLPVGGTASNSNLVYGLNQAALTAAILAGNAATASNATEVYGMDQPTLTAAILAGTAANATKVYGMDQPTLTATILGGTAANANEIGGQTPTAFANTITQQVLTQVQSSLGLVASQGLQDQDTTGAAWEWTALATVPVNAAGPNALPDATFIVQGGDSTADAVSGLWLVQLGTRGPSNAPVTMAVLNLTGQSMGYTAAAQFGWTIAAGSVAGTQTVTLWMKSHGSRNFFTTTELAQQSCSLLASAAAQATEPSGITYITEDAFARLSDVSTLVTQMTNQYTALTALITS
jgi:hypothetical protein